MAHYDSAFGLPSSNGAWAADRELLYVNSYNYHLILANPEDDSSTSLGEQNSIPCAVRGSRLILDASVDDDPSHTNLVTTDLDGGSPQAFLTIDRMPHYSFDITP